MTTNHNRTLYNDYIAALLGKETAEVQVRTLNVQCRKLELYAANLAEESNRKDTVINKLQSVIGVMEKQLPSCGLPADIELPNSSGIDLAGLFLPFLIL